MARRSLAIILAAGEGTRMRSDLPKVLHPIAHRPMVCHVAAACEAAGIDDLAFVVGTKARLVRERVASDFPQASFHEQRERRGTAHAVLCAREALSADHESVLVLFGDVPLVGSEAIRSLLDARAEGADVVALGFETDDPKGYGRMVVRDGKLARIVEEKDASEEERRISFCNAGLMAFRADLALDLLDAVGSQNAQNEFYLPDTVAIANERRLVVTALATDEEETLGVNDRVQLADREVRWQRRARERAMRDGVSMQAPETVHLAWDTALAADCTVEPNVWFGPGVSVARGARIRANCHLEGAQVGEDCEVGPYARLRPGAVLEPGAKVGNFVEVKSAVLRRGAKVNHLSYVGDAEVGEASNVGAGVVTANYDGFGKYRTVIGADAFVGTNSTLVAPVSVGEGANVAAGSVITHDVPAGSLTFGRARQEDKPGRAGPFREEARRRKEARKGAVKPS